MKIGKDVCTIRYIGSLPKWPSSIAYGVEWDDPTRGKNCGIYQGEVYFKTTSKLGGSFIKESTLASKAQSGVTFLQAVQEKYLTPFKLEKAYLGSKRLEAVGFDKLNKRQEDVRSFTKMSLDGLLINQKLYSVEELAIIREDFGQIDDLDLSYNLFSNFEKVCELLEQFRNVRCLDLSGNRFNKGFNFSRQFCFKQIEFLSLNNCGLDSVQLQLILKVFPSIEVLDIGKNNLLKSGCESVKFPRSLRELNFSYNGLKVLSQNFCDHHIESLNLSNNKIEMIKFVHSFSLKEIDLSSNFIDKWETLDEVNVSFPTLISIRVNSNPITLKDSITDFYQVIARFNKVSIANGSLLPTGMRSEAELYFVSMLRKGEITFNRKLERWSYLLDTYKVLSVNTNSSKMGFDSLDCTLKIINQDTKESRNVRVLSSFSVRYLKHICSRMFGLDLLQIDLYHLVSPEVIDELNHEFYCLSHFNVADGDIIHLKPNNVRCKQDKLMTNDSIK